MDLVAGAMGNLAPKLLQLVQDEYKLQKDVRAQVQSLADELNSMHVALCKVAQVPHDKLDPQVKLWASEAREASYDMEDILDTFLVRVDGGHKPADADKGKVDLLLEKMSKVFSLSKLKARREIAGAIEDIKKQVDEMARRRDRQGNLMRFSDFNLKRYRVDDHRANPAAATSIDPRVLTLHTKASDLVGIDKPRDELIEMLTYGGDDASNKTMRIVSVVGSGGLGKTTLAKVVYEKLTVDMNIDRKAFVPVGRKPDLKKVLRDILLDLDKDCYMNKTNFMILDEKQLIKEIQELLDGKRYFIVIDDVWEVSSWKKIRIALEDKNLESKIIITTRHIDVAELAHCTYKIKPLLPDISEMLFYGRIFGSQDKCPEDFSELSDKILKKCGGVPLAIITIASLLSNKSNDIKEWQEVFNSIGYGLLSNSNDMYNDMRKILSLSYYDLPPQLKTCFLYLSMYPEDYLIHRDRLIWRWISEGFIQPQRKGDDLFELGNSYFNDLINRSLVQPVSQMYYKDNIFACRVHDMILELICSLSREENFVTTSDDIESSKSKRLRRLFLKNTTWPTTDVSKVRSIVLFRLSVDSMPSFSVFNMLRVLDLDCYLRDTEYSKLYVEKLIHLRYLGLRGIREVPRGIEKLQFLQVLNMDSYPDKLMPPSIFGLRRLMCLKSGVCHPKPGNLLRNLVSLQVLRTLYVDEDSASVVEELRHLTQLTSLCIEINLQMDQCICDALTSSLGSLPRLETLTINYWGDRLITWESWAPPPRLRELCIHGKGFLQTLPKWISPASLPHLTCLTLQYMVHSVRPEDIQMLGMLPNLLLLLLRPARGNFLERPLQKLVVSAGAFPRATRCFFDNFVVVPSMFTRGAMPRAEIIWFCIRATDFFCNGGLDFDDLAMEHLPSLRIVYFSVYGVAEVSKDERMKLEEALQHAADVHPNHPSMNAYDYN